MGRTKYVWVIKLKIESELWRLKTLVDRYNNIYGRDLDFFCIIKYDDAIYGCVGTDEYNISMSSFMGKYADNFSTMYCPFVRPAGWPIKKKFLWISKNPHTPPPGNLWDLLQRG